MNRRCFVQLGRIGDILNVLPLAKLHHEQTGEIPWFVVAREFAGVLDGVSYVEPIIFEGKFEEVYGGVFLAHQRTKNVTVCQVYGKGLIYEQESSSFCRESWWRAGAQVPWGSLPLVFDRRDPIREAQLIARYIDPNRKQYVVLVALEGKSSPFPYNKALLSSLQRLAYYQVIDLSQVKAERFYDLLGLFEIAHCLISIDTAHQHLAAASNVPVISLVTRDPSPWHGSPWRKNQVQRIFYDEFPERLAEIRGSLFDAIRPNHEPKIIHVWADWRLGTPSEDTQRRARVAQESWAPEYASGNWVPAECKRSDVDRDGTKLGDPHPVPFVHDVLRHAEKHCSKDSDIIVLSNGDICFTPGLTGHILDHIDRKGCFFTHRRDFESIPEPFIHDAQVRKGAFYPGTDLVGFTLRWWKQHRHEYGDYVMGREAWDEVIRQLIKYWGGEELEFACYHEWHDSFWCGPERWTLLGNVHNYRLREEWFATNGFTQEDFRYFRCKPSQAEHPKPYPKEPGRAP